VPKAAANFFAVALPMGRRSFSMPERWGMGALKRFRLEGEKESLLHLGDEGG